MVIETAKQQLIYDPDTGEFTWSVAKPRIHVGMSAGNRTRKGYVVLELNGRQYKAHNLAWAMHYGYWPKAFVDHINGVRHDNRIANLREATGTDNARNRALSRNNVSGVSGVTWRDSHKAWCARITVNNKRLHLGYYGSLDDARAARYAAERQYYGVFAPSLSREPTC
jgi:hypothetical protein